MARNALLDRLGIEHPILLAPMAAAGERLARISRTRS